MLSQSQIKRLIESHTDTKMTPDMINGSKNYYLFFQSENMDFESDLRSIEPYAPHWPVNKYVVGTSKLVYANIISDMIQSRGGHVSMIYGQAIPQS